MIKNIQLRVSADPRGKIKSGMKNAKGLPQSLDYFNVSKFPELEIAYGLKPAMLIVFFPTDNITDFFDTNYDRWGRAKGKDKEGVLIRRCNGEVCVHRIDETIDGTKYAAGEESECVCRKHSDKMKQDEKCRWITSFSAYIATPQTGKINSPMCYRFESSENSGKNILSQLEQFKVVNNGSLLGVPFALSVKMVSGKKAKEKFPVWNIIPIGTLTEIKKRLERFSLEPVVGLLPEAPKETKTPISEEEGKKEKALKEIKAAKDRAKLKELFEKVSDQLKKKEISDDDFSILRDALNDRWKEVK